MATTSVIDSGGGGDYTTIAAWEDATDTDLVTRDDGTESGLCNNETFSESVVIAGATTDATRYRILTTQANESFRDLASVLRYGVDGAKMTSTATGDGTLGVDENFFEVRGLQIQNSNTGNSGRAIGAIDPVGTFTCDACILQSSAAVNPVVTFGSGGDSYTGNFNNTLMIKTADTPGIETDRFNTVNLDSCTIVCPTNVTNNDNATETIRAGAVMNATNCAFFGFTNAHAGSGTWNPSDCATDATDTDIDADNGLDGLTYADQFEENDSTSGAEDFRIVTGGSLDDAGATTLTEDIFGTSRPQTTDDIGCFEIEAAGGGTFSGHGKLLAGERNMLVAS